MTILVIHMRSHLGPFYRNKRDSRELKIQRGSKNIYLGGVANDSEERLLELKSDINSWWSSIFEMEHS